MEAAVPKKKKKKRQRLQLTEARIARWAETHFQRTGRWPTNMAGAVKEVPGLKWGTVNYALTKGAHGLPGGTSLPRMLRRWFGKRLGPRRSPLSRRQIIAWVREHFARTGQWPSSHSGPVVGGYGESWASVDQALRSGSRGLAGGSSLAQLLDSVAGPKRRRKRPTLTIRQILEWADKHKARTGDWPTASSGPVHESPDDTWRAVHAALRSGCRGLPRGGSLARLLEKYRGRPLGQGKLRRPLSDTLVLKWADTYHREHDRWPSLNSGQIEEAPELSWKRVNFALRLGLYGLRGDRSLAQLLREERGESASYVRMPLKVEQILRWADLYHRRTGRWPTGSIGRRTGDMPLTWVSIDRRLAAGQVPGVPEGTRLTQLIAKRRHGG
jgi:hypothetical protein